jgi:hypothetical protein
MTLGGKGANFRWKRIGAQVEKAMRPRDCPSSPRYDVVARPDRRGATYRHYRAHGFIEPIVSDSRREASGRPKVVPIGITRADTQ